MEKKTIMLTAALITLLVILIYNLIMTQYSIDILKVILILSIIVVLKKITTKPIHLILGFCLLIISIIILIILSFNWTIGLGYYYILLDNDVTLPNKIFFYVLLIFLTESIINLFSKNFNKNKQA